MITHHLLSFNSLDQVVIWGTNNDIVLYLPLKLKFLQKCLEICFTSKI